MGTINTFGVNHRLQRIEPFAGFLRIYVLNRFHQRIPVFPEALDFSAVCSTMFRQ
jgi:hypothetical protein